MGKQQSILKLPPKDLWVSYSWSNNNHGICGHTLEVIEYYYLLKDEFDVGIFIAEKAIDWSDINTLIRSKYTFTEKEIDDIRDAIIFGDKPKLLAGSNIILTDGGIISMKNKTLIFDNIIYFACGNKEVKDNLKENVWILQDDRIYSPVKKNGLNYIKKILFSKLKTPLKSKPRSLVYATKNCRNITEREIGELSEEYGELIVITNNENKPKKEMAGVEFKVPPIDDFFEEFDQYIYTRVERKFDCSPRLIAECMYMGKDVIYKNIDYLDEDLGLYYRKQDLENGIESIDLNKNDTIFNILKTIGVRE